MSRRWSGAALLGALLLAAPLKAQVASQEAELLAEIERLTPLVEEAAVEVREARERAEEESRRRASEAAQVDSLTVGLVRVITPADQTDRARELFTEVWEEHYAWIETSPSLESAWLTFQWDEEPVPIHVEGPIRRDVHVGVRERRRAAVARIRAAIAAVLMYDLATSGARVGQWVQGNPLTHDDVRAQAAYRQLATTRSRAARSCLAGDLEACRLSLGLGGDEVSVSELYGPEEQRLLVAARMDTGTRSRPADVAACVDEARTDTCGRLLDFVQGSGTSLVPAGPGARAMLFALALDRGGPGAWSRALERPEAGPAETLAHVAQEPIEALVGAWYDQLQRDRPEPYASLPFRSGLALMWTALCVGLAMRSTRWRFG